MRGGVHLVLAGLLGALFVPGAFGADPAGRLAAAGSEFLEALDEDGADEALYPFDDDERFDLRLAPILLDGVRLLDLDEEAEARARALVATALSEEGFRKVETIMSLEREVEALERGTFGLRWFQHFLRDPRRYFLALFGEPSTGRPWGFRFDGHHVSLNVTSVPGSVPSATPLFLGAQPRRVPGGFEREGLEVLHAEENLARELVLSLDERQRRFAILPFRSGRGWFAGDERAVEISCGEVGLPRRDLRAQQRDTLDALVEVYLRNLDPDVAASFRERIDTAGRDAIRFAWAGGTAPGEPHYYRIHGPAVLIEFDNSLEGADHVHTILRDPEGDFGEDLLARHYAEEGH